MDNKLKTILDDLYKFDPGLKDFEEEIIKIINQYMLNKPDTKFDAEFAKKLKAEIISKAKAQTVPASAKNAFSFPLFYKISYAMGIAALVFLIILPFTPLFKTKTVTLTKNNGELSLETLKGISPVGNAAFGKLGTVGSQGATMNAGIRDAATLQAKDASATGRGGGGGIASPEASKMMPPIFETTNYKYIYKGEEIKQDQESVNVYKRNRGGITSNNLSRMITGLKTDLIDLGKFSGAKLANLNLTEDKDLGYSVYFNFDESTISIFSNYLKWQRPERNCKDDACFKQYRITIDKIPADDKIISMAGEFVKEYGLDMSAYGEPFIQDNWRLGYEAAQTKDDYYLPEEIAVIYPLVIDGKTVYDESGYPSGLYVGVNILFNKVSNVNVITPQKYDSSAYAAVTDTKRIMDIATQGGMYGEYKDPNAAKTVEIELGTPALSLMRYYSYNQDTGLSDELYIPCYVFPINSISDKTVYYYKKNIVVPIVKDILDQVETQPGIPEPMPLIKSEPGTATINSDNVTSGSAAENLPAEKTIIENR